MDDSTTYRAQAQARLKTLLETLRALPDPAMSAPLIELGEHLDRAISSFHMEAIRFRMFTLARHLKEPGLSLPEEIHAQYNAVRESLEAAGFHTRSVPTEH